MPQILHVPGFEGIRIHKGNTEADTLGCILVGQQRTDDKVINSKMAYDELFQILKRACAREKVLIKIVKELA